MGKIDTNDFSGGIQESFAPDDFSPRQSAVLKGIVPTNDRTFESQWGLQSIGNLTGANAIFPLESQFGTFLVAIKGEGSIWWVKVPTDTASKDTANAVTWTQITTAQNKGYAPGVSATQPSITIENNPDYRFITGLSFEVYKYVKTPDATTPAKDNFWFDDIGTADDATSTLPSSVVSGVLIHSRRYYDDSNTLDWGGRDKITPVTKSAYVTQVAVVCYVDPFTETVKAVTFPNIRRWPMYYKNGKPSTDTSTLPADVLTYKPWIASKKHALGAVTTFTSAYPFPNPMVGYPRFMNVFHPYTYYDANKAVLPGVGIIPRANIGTMWGGLLILGDIEYMNDKISTVDTDITMTPAANTAMLGTSYATNVLRDGSTAPHRGSFYYSEGEIDVFDPRSQLRTSGSDTRIAGMHVIDNRLITITTSGGENDGVIVWSGNLSGLKSYATGTANPFAVRKQVLKGGVGVADYADNGGGHINQTCLWPDAGTVLFVDSRGGVFSTNGQTVNRIDAYGPKQPKYSTYSDHTAAVGKYAFIWRDRRLMLFTAVGYQDGQLSGCWTELVTPPISAPVAASDLKSMVGSGNNMFLIADGIVWRYAINGLPSERGQINGVNTDITISTASFGAPQDYAKVNWDKFGVNFSTTTGCTLKSITVNGGPALQIGTPSYTAISSSRSFTEGYHSVIVPAGIGSRTIVSATYVLQGQFVLESNTFWFNGSTTNKEKTNV